MQLAIVLTPTFRYDYRRPFSALGSPSEEAEGRAAFWNLGDAAPEYFVSPTTQAVQHAGVAGRRRGGPSGLLPNTGHGDGARHPVLLGRAHDHDEPGAHWQGALPHRAAPWPGELKI